MLQVKITRRGNKGSKEYFCGIEPQAGGSGSSDSIITPHLDFIKILPVFFQAC
jgi:hypothetical protein